MRFAAIVSCMRNIRSFLGPLENRQLRIAAMDHDPSHRIVALGSANLASIDRIDQTQTSNKILVAFSSLAFGAYVCYSSICRFNGGSNRHSIVLIVLSARCNADDLQGSTVTTNGSACAG